MLFVGVPLKGVGRKMCAFLLKYGAVPTLNLPPGSDMSCQSDVKMKPAAVSSLSEFEILMPEIEKPGEGIQDFGHT